MSKTFQVFYVFLADLNRNTAKNLGDQICKVYQDFMVDPLAVEVRFESFQGALLMVYEIDTAVSFYQGPKSKKVKLN
jgi:hypothetical protein